MRPSIRCVPAASSTTSSTSCSSSSAAAPCARATGCRPSASWPSACTWPARACARRSPICRRAGSWRAEPGGAGRSCSTSWVPEDLQPAAVPDADRFRALLEARRVLEPALARLAAAAHGSRGAGSAGGRGRRAARTGRGPPTRRPGRGPLPPADVAPRRTTRRWSARCATSTSSSRPCSTWRCAPPTTPSARCEAHEQTLAALRDGDPAGGGRRDGRPPRADGGDLRAVHRAAASADQR